MSDKVDPKPTFSVSIQPETSTSVLDACDVLMIQLNKLYSAKNPPPEAATDTSLTSAKNTSRPHVESITPKDLKEHLIRAANECDNDLIRSVVKHGDQTSWKPPEIMVSLLLFLKNYSRFEKLEMAFHLLTKQQQSNQESKENQTLDTNRQAAKTDRHGRQSSDQQKATEATATTATTKGLTQESLKTLFRCLMTTIALCTGVCDTNADKGSSTTAAAAAAATTTKTTLTTKMLIKRERNEGTEPRKAQKQDGQSSPCSATLNKSESRDSSSGHQSMEAPACSASFEDGMDIDGSYIKLSQSLVDEINKVATHMVSRVLAEARNAKDKDGGRGGEEEEEEEGNDKADVSFDAFREWYENGDRCGLQCIDLLDVSKWKKCTMDGADPDREENDDGRSDGNGKTMKVDVSVKDEGTTSAIVNGETNNAQKDIVDASEKYDADEDVEGIKEETRSKDNAGGRQPQVQMQTQIQQPPQSESKSNEKSETPLNFFAVSEEKSKSKDESKTLISFDFTSSDPQTGSECNTSQFLHINITEHNLKTLRTLVHRTTLSGRSPDYVCQILMKHCTTKDVGGHAVSLLKKENFGCCIRDMVPEDVARSFSKTEMESFSSQFIDLLSCYELDRDVIGDAGFVDVKELAVGFSLLCGGNKSSKLVTGFELLDLEGRGSLKSDQLKKFFRSYLTMLSGISFLSSTSSESREVSSQRKAAMSNAVEHGAEWTLGHFMKFVGDDKNKNKDKDKSYPFESVAKWYTEGGYNIAPWLELLNLRKLLSLLNDSPGHIGPSSSSSLMSSSVSASRIAVPPEFAVSNGRGVMSSPRRRRGGGGDGYGALPPVDVLFTFPLAKERSLIVLREDATYVRSVVEKLGLLSLSPDDLWGTLFVKVKSKPLPPPQPWSRSRHRKSGKGKGMDVDRETFVRSMEETMAKMKKKKKTMTTNGSSKKGSNGMVLSEVGGTKETLGNFFQSFDLEQMDRVALNQLMGGLSLLCGGKKSTKLAFCFGLFDGRKESKSKMKNPSLNVEDMFVFLRSFLIVMFSCCRQSLDLSSEAVGRYISDTAHMVAEDVMRYQWHNRKKDRVDFDEFGEWYNEGGFETAPWLELLDLKKWVLLDKTESAGMIGTTANAGASTSALATARSPKIAAEPSLNSRHGADYCPPAPPDDAVDASFFGGEDDHALIPMDSIDEMDIMMLQQQHSSDGSLLGGGSVPATPTPSGRSPGKARQGRESNSLKFHLVSSESNGGGYMLSVSQRRVRHLRRILVESGLHTVEAEVACRVIINKARPMRNSDGDERLILEKKEFDAAIREIVARGDQRGEMADETQRVLMEMLSFMFEAFDCDKNGKPDALEVACGFSVLCNGKKSDKLESGFEVLDRKKYGKLRSDEMSNYLQSFLVVLLSVSTLSCLDSDEYEDSMLMMNGDSCKKDAVGISRAADAGATWATSQAFKGCFPTVAPNGESALSFDEFAEWYTRKGFGSIPWLELLDLKKWVLA